MKLPKISFIISVFFITCLSITSVFAGNSDPKKVKLIEKEKTLSVYVHAQTGYLTQEKVKALAEWTYNKITTEELSLFENATRQFKIPMVRLERMEIALGYNLTEVNEILVHHKEENILESSKVIGLSFVKRNEEGKDMCFGFIGIEEITAALSMEKFDEIENSKEANSAVKILESGQYQSEVYSEDGYVFGLSKINDFLRKRKKN